MVPTRNEEDIPPNEGGGLDDSLPPLDPGDIGAIYVDYEDFIQVYNRYLGLLDATMAYVGIHEEGPPGHDCPQCNLFRFVRKMHREEYER